jgi:hypothetical protein
LKLSVNLIDKGRFIRAGEELPPDSELPEHIRALAVDEECEQVVNSRLDSQAGARPKPKRGPHAQKSF